MWLLPNNGINRTRFNVAFFVYACGLCRALGCSPFFMAVKFVTCVAAVSPHVVSAVRRRPITPGSTGQRRELG